MKKFLQSLVCVALGLLVAFWGLYIMSMKRFEKRGEVHLIGEFNIEVERPTKDIFLMVSNLKRQPVLDEEEAPTGDVEWVEDSEANGTEIIGLPGLQDMGQASVELVDYRKPDFLMYQERFQALIFLHGIGLEETRPGVTRISWQIQSPNTQWWFHGCVMHLSSLFWNQRMPEVLNIAKEKIEKS